jgi:hypothetical protein
LEESDEEEGGTGKGRDEHGRVDDPGVDTLDGDSKEEAANGNLGEDHGAAVEEVAVEPAVLGALDVEGAEVVVVSAGSIMYTQGRGGHVSSEEYLGGVSSVACSGSDGRRTVEPTMSQSSTPNALTMRSRT